MTKSTTKNENLRTKRVTQSEKIITETENKVKNLDITKFIEETPVAKLSGTYQSELLNIIKTEFTEFDQRVFLFNFYCSFNYDEENDFVIDLNQVWPWLGFTRKDHAKHLLEKEFEKDVDFVIDFAPVLSGAKNQTENRGGHNKERILLTVDCFKVFCMTAKKPKAKLIRRYYVKLEKLIQQIIKKQSNEMKNLLCLKETENQQLQQELEETKEMVLTTREETLTKSFDKKQTIYLAYVEDGVIKFGYSDDIKHRLYIHKSEKYGFGSNFNLIFVTDSIFNIQIERMIKNRLKEHIFSKEYNGNNQTELIRITPDFTEKMLCDEIKSYKRMCENLDKVFEIVKENDQLKTKLERLECKYRELQIKHKEVSGEIPVEYKIVKDESLEMEIKIKVIFLEFVLEFINNYENINKLEQCKFYENKKGIIKIEKDDFYNIYEEYVKINKLFSFKIDDGKIANYIPMDSKTIQFLHMKTTRMNRTVNGERFRPTVRVFYINELKEYIPKKIEELKSTNCQKEIKIIQETNKIVKNQIRLRNEQNAYKYVKYIIENVPEYLTEIYDGVYRVHKDDFYKNYLKHNIENDLTENKFAEIIKRDLKIVQTKHSKSKSYKKINKNLVEQKLQELII